MKTAAVLPLVSLLLLPAACAKSTADTAPATPEPSAQAEPADAEDDSADDPSKASIILDAKLAELCSIPTAHFEFDSSNLGEEAQTALDALAECFLTGPAKGKGMRMVGHADPRGTEEYNLALGSRRAGSVAGYLGGKGVGNPNIETSSRGELDATGTDETTWALDRKVEIFLVE